MGLSELSGTILDYLRLSRTILDYIRLSRTGVQVEAGESKLLLFETFWLYYFFFLLERFLEELALLKNQLYSECKIKIKLVILHYSLDKR